MHEFFGDCWCPLCLRGQQAFLRASSLMPSKSSLMWRRAVLSRGNGIRPLLSSYCPNMTIAPTKVRRMVKLPCTGPSAGTLITWRRVHYTSSGSGYTSHAEWERFPVVVRRTLVANSSDSSLSNNQYVEILWGPRSGSNTWSVQDGITTEAVIRI